MQTARLLSDLCRQKQQQRIVWRCHEAKALVVPSRLSIERIDKQTNPTRFGINAL